MTAGGSDMPGEADFWVHLATAPGTAGLAVVELYGPGAPEALAKTTHLPSSRLPAEGALRLAVLRDTTGESVDDVMVSRFDDESSWCGLAGWSVSCHGGAVVTSRVLQIFTDLGGRRTGAADLLRLNPALDSLQRAAHGCLLESRTERAATYFLGIFSGALGSRLAELLRAFESAESSLEGVADGLIGMIGDAGAALRLARPMRLLIAGRPNVGKSTLFNALLGDERVVVSSVSGTTRDLIEETIEIEGYPVTLIDSAGLRFSPGTDPVEQEGVQRALTAERDAVLFLLDVSDGVVEDEVETALLGSIPDGAAQVMMVWSKGDLVEAAPAHSSAENGSAEKGSAENLVISALSGAGLDQLREAIRARWLGPPENRALGAAPFTLELVEAFRELGARLKQMPSAAAATPRRPAAPGRAEMPQRPAAPGRAEMPQRPAAPGRADLDAVRRAFIECLGLREDFAKGRPPASKEIDERH